MNAGLFLMLTLLEHDCTSLHITNSFVIHVEKLLPHYANTYLLLEKQKSYVERHPRSTEVLRRKTFNSIYLDCSFYVYVIILKKVQHYSLYRIKTIADFNPSIQYIHSSNFLRRHRVKVVPPFIFYIVFNI